MKFRKIASTATNIFWLLFTRFWFDFLRFQVKEIEITYLVATLRSNYFDILFAVFGELLQKKFSSTIFLGCLHVGAEGVLEICPNLPRQSKM